MAQKSLMGGCSKSSSPSKVNLLASLSTDGGYGYIDGSCHDKVVPLASQYCLLIFCLLIDEKERERHLFVVPLI